MIWGFQLGQEVDWRPSGNRKAAPRRGRVVAVILPGGLPSKSNFPSVFKRYGGGVRLPRDVESYVVEVSGQHYWPAVDELSQAGALVPDWGFDCTPRSALPEEPLRRLLAAKWAESLMEKIPPEDANGKPNRAREALRSVIDRAPRVEELTAGPLWALAMRAKLDALLSALPVMTAQPNPLSQQWCFEIADAAGGLGGTLSDDDPEATAIKSVAAAASAAGNEGGIDLSRPPRTPGAKQAGWHLCAVIVAWRNTSSTAPSAGNRV